VTDAPKGASSAGDGPLFRAADRFMDRNFIGDDRTVLEKEENVDSNVFVQSKVETAFNSFIRRQAPPVYAFKQFLEGTLNRPWRVVLAMDEVSKEPK
jgi:hypothetical protein